MTFFAIAIAFMLLQGFFSGIETGLISILKPRLQHALEKNVKGAHILAFFLNSPSRMLGTTLIGTNICIAVASNFAKEGLEGLGFGGQAPMLALSVVMACCFLTLEIVAKDWFRQQPYQRCLVFAYILYASYVILWIPVKMMSAFTAVLNKLAQKKPLDEDSSRNLIREDFTLFVRDSERDGTIDSQAADMLDRSLDFSKLKAKNIMIPKTAVKEIDMSWTIAQAVGLSRLCGKSRLPVSSSQTHNQWKGVFSVYDAIFKIPENEWTEKKVSEILRPIASVEENSPLDEIMSAAKKSRVPIVAVRSSNDEKKHVGIVTPSDVIRQIFGGEKISQSV